MSLLERMIIESLAYRKQDLFMLVEDIGLNERIIFKVLERLVEKGLIDNLNGIYCLNRERLHNLYEGHEFKQSVKSEVSELVRSMLHKHLDEGKREQVSLKKVWVSEKEEKILQSLIYNLTSYLDNLDKSAQELSESQRKLKNKKVFFFGMDNYLEIMQSYLNRI